jgi:hypothetical protein
VFSKHDIAISIRNDIICYTCTLIIHNFIGPSYDEIMLGHCPLLH